MRLVLIMAVCTLSACATGSAPAKPEPIPPDLIPPGYTARECRITDPGGAITAPGPEGRPVTVGERKPKVECARHIERITATDAATCHTKGGRELPLSACCMNPDGSPIAGCTPALQPPAE
jgi:hypothetical protein